MTTLFEGSIIRSFRRLSEVLVQLASAARKVRCPFITRVWETGKG
jgi:superfamily II RNA helicase